MFVPVQSCTHYLSLGFNLVELILQRLRLHEEKARSCYWSLWQETNVRASPWDQGGSFSTHAPTKGQVLDTQARMVVHSPGL